MWDTLTTVMVFCILAFTFLAGFLFGLAARRPDEKGKVPGRHDESR